MVDPNHIKYNEALQNRQYRSLVIKRLDQECFLLIDIDGDAHVFVNRHGKPQTYQNIWEVKKWLKSKFGLNTDGITVIVQKSKS